MPETPPNTPDVLPAAAEHPHGQAWAVPASISGAMTNRLSQAARRAQAAAGGRPLPVRKR